MAKISIIIPVYNASRYLLECMDSILAQAFVDIEIICIDDGSTDDSLEILKIYATKDSRIIIIDQPNQGVSAARNAGLKMAAGKYIGFVDSDDSIHAAFFENLFRAAENNEADIVFSQGLSNSNSIIFDKVHCRSEIRERILPLFFKEDGYNAVWNKLYSAEVIRKNKVVFPVGKSHGEDAEFNIHFLIHASNLYALDCSGYNYRETERSATRNASRFDYLTQAVETFVRDWSFLLGDIIPGGTMHSFRKERFINNIISQIYIYADPKNGMSRRLKIAKISEIVSHEVVIRVFNQDNAKVLSGFPRYKNAVYEGIRKKSVFTLYLLSMYSYYRNH